MYSLNPISHEAYGWAKKNSVNSFFDISLCLANSLPLSDVIDKTNFLGSTANIVEFFNFA